MDKKKSSSASSARPLTLKTGACQRYANDIVMYMDEISSIRANIQKLRDGGAEPSDLKAHQERLLESENVLSDTRGRASQAYQSLKVVVESAKQDETLSSSSQFPEALSALNRLQGMLDECPMEEKKQLKIAVYGSPNCQQDDELWRLSSLLGQQLATNGFHIMSGDEGAMEAVAKAAVAVNGAVVEGVVCPSIRPRNSNFPFTTLTKATHLYQRLQIFNERANVHIFLPGSVDTASELMVSWNVAIANNANNRPSAPVFAFRRPWEAIIQALCGGLKIGANFANLISFVDTVEDLVVLLKKLNVK